MIVQKVWTTEVGKSVFPISPPPERWRRSHLSLSICEGTTLLRRGVAPCEWRQALLPRARTD